VSTNILGFILKDILEGTWVYGIRIHKHKC